MTAGPLGRGQVTLRHAAGSGRDSLTTEPDLVQVALAGRYLHAEHDDVDELLSRIDEVREHDLNAIRLRR